MSDNAESQSQNVQPDTRECVKGCGFFGSAQTGYMCSRCFKDAAGAMRASVEAPAPASISVTPSTPVVASASVSVETPKPEVAPAVVDTAATKAVTTTPQKTRTRCYCCNKKVGFTGIECRCGFVYCGTHRYPDQHNCTFDFKTHDRENLQKVVMGGGEFSKIDHL